MHGFAFFCKLFCNLFCNLFDGHPVVCPVVCGFGPTRNMAIFIAIFIAILMSKYRAKCQNFVHDARFFVHRQISQKFLYLLNYCKSARKHPGGGSFQNFFRGFSFWCRWWGSNPSSFVEMSCPSRIFILPLSFSLQNYCMRCEAVECAQSRSAFQREFIWQAICVGCGAIFTHTPTFCSK